MTPTDARKLIADNTKPVTTETVPLDQALGRILREPILADRPLPPFNRVMMDGYAVQLNRSTWTISHRQAAGEKPFELTDPGAAIEIMTGASLPEGTDTVIPYEDTLLTDEHTFSLKEDARAERGQFIHQSGTDARSGQNLLEPGRLLGGKELAVCASVGKAQIAVSRLPKLAFMSTGGELIPVTDTPAIQQIRRSNDKAIYGVIAQYGLALNQNVHIKDDPYAITTQLTTLAEHNDIIVASGGVSKGKYDFVADCIEQAGFQLLFHRIKQKPGGPLLAATREDGKWLIGLPGNPMSSLICAHIYLTDLLTHLLGTERKKHTVKVSDQIQALDKKDRFAPVRIDSHSNDATEATMNTSGDFVNVLNSDGFVHIPAKAAIEAQDELCYYPWL